MVCGFLKFSGRFSSHHSKILKRLRQAQSDNFRKVDQDERFLKLKKQTA